MYRSLPEPLGWSAVGMVGVLAPVAVVGLIVYLAIGASDAVQSLSGADWLSERWSPLSGQFGVLPIVVGTLYLAVLATAAAVLVGLAAALYLALFAPRRLRLAGEAAVGALGAVPSVVIGLWAMTWFVPRLGNSAACGVVVLAVMIVPTFTLLAGAALRQVPADLADTLRALGIGDDTLAIVVLWHARWGVLGAAVLAACRALGEAVALSLVVGNVVQWPSLGEPVATLTTTLIVEFDGAAGVHRSALHVLALGAVALIAAVSIAGQAMRRRMRSHI